MKKGAAICMVTLLVFVAFFNLMPEVSELEREPDKRIPKPLVNDAFLPGDVLERERTKGSDNEPMLPAPGFLETSEYMMGSIAVAIILPESNGTSEAETENWNATEINNVFNEIQDSLNWWASLEPNASVSFVYEPLSPRVLNTTYEPINHAGGGPPAGEEDIWVYEIMMDLGYIMGTYWDKVRTFNNDMRTLLGTDWAFTIFVADSSNDSDGTFTDGSFGYAYLGGPFVVMTYDNDGWGISQMDKVTAHEVGHIFWATDEYDVVPEDSGYLNIFDNDLSGCVMDTSALCASPGTRGQIGWRDTDTDTIMDILDVPPNTVLVPFFPDPTNDNTPTYTGTATVGTINNLNSKDPLLTDTTINKIALVEYRVDAGPWTPANPVDGTWNDDDIEDYNFTIAPALPDGVYTIEAKAKVTVNGIDIYDTSPASDIISIDTGKPTSSVDALPIYTTTSIFTVNATASDNAGGTGLKNVTLWYSKDGALYLPYSTDTALPWSFSFDTSTTGGDGIYDFYSIAYDNAGSAEDLPLVPPDNSTIVDTQKPSSSVDALATYISSTTFNVDVTVLPDANGIQKAELWYDKDSTGWNYHSDDTVPPYSWFFDTTTTGGDGTYCFYSRAWDIPNNYEDAPIGADTCPVVDTEKPSSSVDPLPTYTNNVFFTVNVTASDLTSGVKNVTLWFNNGTGWSKYLPNDSTPPYSWIFNTLTGGGDGTYEFYSRAYDNASNYEDAPAGNDTWIIVDTLKPSSSVDALPTYTNSSIFTVNLTVVPDANGIQKVELWYNNSAGWTQLLPDDTTPPYSWSFNTATTGGDGTYEFYSRAWDNVNNNEDAPLGNDTWTMVDTLKPSSSVDSLPTFTNITAFIVTVTASDLTSGLYKVDLFYNNGTGYLYYDTDTSPPWSFNFDTLTTGGDGKYEFYSRAWDSANNYEDEPLSNDTLTIVDTQKPTSAVDPLPTYTNTVIFTVNITASDLTSGVMNVSLWYNWNGTGYVLFGTITSSPWYFNFDSSTTGGDGTYEFYARAYDIAGNREDLPVGPEASTLVDVTPPDMQITAPSQNEWFGESDVTVEWIGTDLGSGIEHYEVKLDSENWMDADTDIQYTFTGLWKGYHTIILKAFDNATNNNTSSSITFNIDLTPPNLSITAPSNNSKTSLSKVKITWIGFDLGSGIDHYEVKLDSGDYVNVGTNNTYTFTQLEDGNRKFTVKAVDNVGHATETYIGVQVGDGDTDGDPIYDGRDDIALPDWLILLLLIVFVVIIVLLLFAVKRKRKKGSKHIEPHKLSKQQQQKPQKPKKPQPSKSSQQKPKGSSPPQSPPSPKT